MLNLTSKRALGFKLGPDVFTIYPGRHPQAVPDGIADLASFRFAHKAGEVTIHETQKPASKPVAKAKPVDEKPVKE